MMNYTCHIIFEESELNLIEKLLDHYDIFKKYFPEKSRKEIDYNLLNELKNIIKSRKELYKSTFDYTLYTERKYKKENPTFKECSDISFVSSIRTNMSMNKAKYLYYILEFYSLYNYDYSDEDKIIFVSIVDIYCFGEEIKTIKTKLLEQIGAAFVFKTKIEGIE